MPTLELIRDKAGLAISEGILLKLFGTKLFLMHKLECVEQCNCRCSHVFQFEVDTVQCMGEHTFGISVYSSCGARIFNKGGSKS